MTELLALHRCLDDCGADSWGRLFCGAALFGIFSRSRWNDLQHAEQMEPDICFDVPVYLEAKVMDHKTKRSNTWSGGVLTAVAPAYGVAQTNWVSSWIDVRSDMFGAFDLDFPVITHLPWRTHQKAVIDEGGKAVAQHGFGQSRTGEWLQETNISFVQGHNAFLSR